MTPGRIYRLKKKAWVIYEDIPEHGWLWLCVSEHWYDEDKGPFYHMKSVATGIMQHSMNPDWYVKRPVG